MVLGNLTEVVLFVADMPRQVAFYRDVLGLAVTYPSGVTDFGGQMWVSLDTGACTLALHGGGTGRAPEQSPRIIFEVADLGVARAELLRRGVEVGEPRAAGPGSWICDARDPDGNRVSIESHT